jgi:Na+/melibiose symporter-like transporter
MVVYVGVCWCMLVYGGVCYVGVCYVGACWCVLVCVGVCWCVLVCVGVCATLAHGEMTVVVILRFRSIFENDHFEKMIIFENG